MSDVFPDDPEPYPLGYVDVRLERDGKEVVMPRTHPKVAAGGAAGALATVIVYVLTQYGVDVPGEVAAALATLIAVIGGWLRSA